MTPGLGDQIAKVFGYLRGLHAAHYIDLGVRLGLFEALAAGPRSSDALADELRLHPPYVRSFCETGFHLELLDRTDGVYRLAPSMDRLLASPEDTYYLGGFPRIHLLTSRDYQHYPELFRTGGTHPYQAHDREFLRGVAEGTRALPRMLLETVGPRFPGILRRLEEGGRVLDFGCGAGHALLTLAERFPRSTGVGIEIEPVSREAARAELSERGLTGRFAVYGDWNDVPGGADGAFDLVTQFLVLHEIRPELKTEALTRCARALKPGGALLLFDEAYPEDDRAARDPIRGFSVVAQWFEVTWGNLINTATEIREMLQAAGLRIADEAELSRFRIVTAVRP
jgi:SAM-dependent methyltransferase